MFNYDCELVMRALMEIKINKSELKPQRVQYDFIEYSEPQLIKTVATFQKEEIHKQIMISTNFASAQLKPPKKLTKFRPELHSSTLSTQKNNFYPNNLYIEKSPSNQNQISPYIPLVETNANMQKIVELEKIENEVKQKIEAALELERETQKQNLEKIMERKLLEWEQNHKNNEIQENIKNKDALLNEMYEKINIEEQKFQMLMKIRELDDENSGLKNFLETCPPYYNYYGKDEVEVEEDEDHEYEELNTNNRVEILKNEEEEKKKREKEFYDLCLQSQNILNSMNMEENERVLHMKLNPELW